MNCRSSPSKCFPLKRTHHTPGETSWDPPAGWTAPALSPTGAQAQTSNKHAIPFASYTKKHTATLYVDGNQKKARVAKLVSKGVLGLFKDDRANKPQSTLTIMGAEVVQVCMNADQCPGLMEIIFNKKSHLLAAPRCV